MSKVNFLDYLKNRPLEQNLILTSNQNLKFHWSDWSESCLFLKEAKNKHFQHSRMQSFELLLEGYKKNPVWLRDKEKELKTNVYDLYLSMLDQRIRTLWTENYKDTLISLVTDAGPYVSLTSMRWFDKNIYTLFVYRKILSDSLPLRNFRIGVDVPAQCNFNGSNLNQTPMNIVQISKSGMLFKIDGPSSISKIQNSREVELSFDLAPFYETYDKKYDGIVRRFSKYDFQNPSKAKLEKFDFYEKDIMKINNNQYNFQLSDGKSFYLFLTYDQLGESEIKHNVKEIMDSILNKIEYKFLDQLSLAS